MRPHEFNEQWRDAFNAGDLPALMAMYEPAAVIVPGPDADPVRGTADIEVALKGFLGLGGRLKFKPRHWIVAGDLIYSSIFFTLEGGAIPLTGFTAEVLRRQDDGSWKYLIDHPFGG